MDTYPDFKTLSAHEVLNLDYRIKLRNLGSPITIAALHGGSIEPRTSLIARCIADETFNCYCFEGIKPSQNKDLHITSHRFDEPRAIELVSQSEVVVTIHASSEKKTVLYVGGLYSELARRIQRTVADVAIETAFSQQYAGRHPENLCNRGRFKKGVQLEFSRGLRDEKPILFVAAKAVRETLKSCPDLLAA